MILMDWLVYSFKSIFQTQSDSPICRPNISSTEIQESRKRAGDNCYPETSKRSRCEVIAPGLPRQRLDGLEIIVQCECEEEDTVTSSEETSGDCYNACFPPCLDPNQSFSDSGCQTFEMDVELEPTPDIIGTTPENFRCIPTRSTSHQAWIKFSEKTANFANAEEQCAALTAAEEIWHNMTSHQKMRYYWDAIDHGTIEFDPFDNFFNFYKTRRKIRSPRARTRISKLWNRLSFDQKLPFIVESLISKMIMVECPMEQCCIKKYLDGYRQRSRKSY